MLTSGSHSSFLPPLSFSLFPPLSFSAPPPLKENRYLQAAKEAAWVNCRALCCLEYYIARICIIQYFCTQTEIYCCNNLMEHLWLKWQMRSIAHDLNVTPWFGCGSLGSTRTAVTHTGIIQILKLKYYSSRISNRVGRKWLLPFDYREIFITANAFSKDFSSFAVCLLQIGQSGGRRSLKIAN